MKVHSNQTSEIGSPIVRAQLWNLSEDVSFLSVELWLKLIFSLPVSYQRIPKTVIIWENWLKSDLDTRKWQLNLQKSLIDMKGCNIWSRRFYTLEAPLIKTMLVSHTKWFWLRIVQTQAILFFKSMSERVGSDTERLCIWGSHLESILSRSRNSNSESFDVGSVSFRHWFWK